jgi:hypothetical protein
MSPDSPIDGGRCQLVEAGGRGRVVYPAVAAAVGETPLPLAELR